MTVRYPANDVTPHGAYQIFTGTHPEMVLKSYDKSVEFYLMGGRAIADRRTPESVQIPKDGLKGLIPPWQHIEQKGATQDGITHVDALYDPIDVQLTAICRGRNGKYLRKVVRDLIASIDAKQESELGFLTHDMGYWWAPVRWHKGAPPDALIGAQQKQQSLSLRLQADNGFWRSYDDTDAFGFTYESMREDFTTTYTTGLGANWPLYYYGGSGGGYPRTRSGIAYWVDDPDDPITTQGRSVMFGPYKNFNTLTDNQVISMEFGSFQEFTFPDGAENHLWGRVGRNVDGTWNGYGIRASIGMFGLELSRFNNFVETRMKLTGIIPPFIGEKWSLVCGGEGNTRFYQVLRGRGQIPVLQHKEVGTSSAMGSAYRGVGGGFRAGGALITQATPGSIRWLSAGDNGKVSQSGFLYRTNIGDQPMYDDYTLFGPGTFKIWDGPNAKADDYVTFGPLLPNQIAFIRTDPRKSGVQDLTVIPPSPQELTQFQQALKQFISFATGNNVPPLLLALQNQFGIRPPQGNIYSLLKGRLSDDCAIPPKSPGAAATPYAVKVAIDDGNANSRIIAAGTPLRRWPL